MSPVILAGIIVVQLNRESIDIDDLQDQINNPGIYAPSIFISIYKIASLLFLPGSLLTLAGGTLFGPWTGNTGNKAASVCEKMLQNILIAIAMLTIVIYIPRILKKLKILTNDHHQTTIVL